MRKRSRITVITVAEKGVLFAREAFDDAIGKPVRMTVFGLDTLGTLLKAEVREDGTQVALTLELEDMILDMRTRGSITPGFGD